MPEENKEYPNGGVIDIVDPRDFEYRIKAGGNKLDTMSKKIINLRSDYQNQGLNYLTRMGCVFYGSGHSHNSNKQLKEIDNFELCETAIKEGLLDIKQGAYVNSGPKLLKKLGFIKGYLLVKGLEQIIDSIDNGSCVIAGSKKINWYKTEKNNGYANITGGAAHIFDIFGYDNRKRILLCKNSYGKNRYNKGNFFISYDDIDCLFYSKYSLVYEKKTIDEVVNDRIDELMPLFKTKAKENQLARVEKLRKETPAQALSYIMYIINNRKEKYIIDDIMYYLKNKGLEVKKGLNNVYKFIKK